MSTSSQTILVTNIDQYWGQQIALRLSHHLHYKVIGIGRTVPKGFADTITCVALNLNAPHLTDFLRQNRVHAVCHVIADDYAIHVEAVVEERIKATRHLFDACAAAGVTKIVWQSSTAVYGAHHTNPAFLTESNPLYSNPTHAFTRTLSHLEAISRQFQQTHPHVDVTTLRFANIVGKTVANATTRWLQGYTMPALLGFDPMMQLIHEDDVAEAFAHVLDQEVSGIFNIAANDVMPLTRIASLSQTPPLLIYHSLAYRWSPARTSTLADYLLFGWNSLRYRWVADTTQMQTVLNFEPRYTAVTALQTFATHKPIRRLGDEADDITQDEGRLRAQLARYQLLKQQLALLPEPHMSNTAAMLKGE